MALSPTAGLLANYILGGAQGPIPTDTGGVPPAVLDLATRVQPQLPIGPPAPPVAHAPGLGAAGGQPSPMNDPRINLIGPAAPSVPSIGGGPAPLAAPQAAQPTAEQRNENALVNAFLTPASAAGAGSSRYEKTTTVQKGTPLSPEREEATEKAFGEQASVGKQNAEDQAELYRNEALHQGIQAQLARDEQAAAQQRGQEARDKQADWDRQWQDASKENPQDIYHGNTFAGVLGTLGQAMGALGASITHTDNWAAKAISSAIDRNVAIQRDKKAGLYQRFRDAGLDAQEADNAARAAGLSAAAFEANRFAAQAQDKDAAGRVKQVAADLQSGVEQLRNKNYVETQGKVTTSSSMAGTSGGGGKAAGNLPAFLAERRKEWISLGRDPAVFDKAAGLTPGSVSGGKSAQRIQTLVAQGENAAETTESLRKNVGGSENDSWVGRQLTRISNATGDLVGTKASAQREVDRTLLTGELGKLVKGGAVDAKEGEKLEKLLGSDDPVKLGQVARRIAGFTNNYKNAAKLSAGPDFEPGDSQ